MVQILYAHVYKQKMVSVETIAGMERERVKENDGEG
jgi:hypothetical protein